MARIQKTVAVCAVALVLMAVMTMLLFTHQDPARLALTVQEMEANIGIPGVSKVYEPVLVNNGLVPVRIPACEDTQDGEVARVPLWSVQRQDPETQGWRDVVPFDECEVVHRWLWPGRSLSLGWEAVAARDGIRLGDHVRFVVAQHRAGSPWNLIASEAILIDECRRYLYRPLGWQATSRQGQWSSDAAVGMELTTRSLEGCFSDRHIEVEFSTRSADTRSVSIARAELVGRDREFVPLRVSETRTTEGVVIRLSWELDESIRIAIGGNPSLGLGLRIDDEQLDVIIRYEIPGRL